MGQKRLHPDLLKYIPMGEGAIIAGHRVTVKHLSGPEARPGGNRYEIIMEGPQFIGGWSFRSGELEKLARSSRSHRLTSDGG